MRLIWINRHQPCCNDLDAEPSGWRYHRGEYQYDLINDANGFSGLTTELVNGQEVITGGVSIATSSLFGTPSNGITTDSTRVPISS